jgi:hypothetical protein
MHHRESCIEALFKSSGKNSKSINIYQITKASNMTRQGKSKQMLPQDNSNTLGQYPPNQKDGCWVRLA